MDSVTYMFVSNTGCSIELKNIHRNAYLHLQYNYFRIKPGGLDLEYQLIDRQS
jgi:hypothetical protein